MQYKNAWTAELATRSAKGLTGPAPTPHPDHLVVDFQAGTVTAIGPLTSDQRALAANGVPGHERVPSPERPLTLSGSRAELFIFKNLPKEEWRVPAPADPDQQVDAIKVLCDVLDDAARTKAMLAILDIPLDQEEKSQKS